MKITILSLFCVFQLRTLIQVLCGTITVSNTKNADQNTDANPCERKSCFYERLCTKPITGGMCTCNRGYHFPDESKDKCVDMDECAHHVHDPCGHRGTCINNPGSFKCVCLGGWEQNSDRCTTNVTETPQCMPGYKGPMCGIGECGAHGFADTLPNSDRFVCICDDGWTHGREDGPCDIDINECDVRPDICGSHGRCENSNGSFTCLCSTGWHGNNCSLYHCTDNGCANQGICIGDVCVCHGNYFRPDCKQINEIHITPVVGQTYPRSFANPVTTTDFLDHVTNTVQTQADRKKDLKTSFYIACVVIGLLLLVLVICTWRLCTYKKKAIRLMKSNVTNLNSGHSRERTQPANIYPYGNNNNLQLNDTMSESDNIYYFS